MEVVVAADGRGSGAGDGSGARGGVVLVAVSVVPENFE